MAGLLTLVVAAALALGVLLVAFSVIVEIRWRFDYQWEHGGRRWFWTAMLCLLLTVWAQETVRSSEALSWLRH